ncbi:MAG: hypothetical protein P0Y59_24885 [Candidatus Sphingomonas phytovorans]|nr:hypothetical protein [Sphingomonas sp.]WEK00090.1 MAG: hypothetical protein P0Y59_24885 [Sphingomonas sp.]
MSAPALESRVSPENEAFRANAVHDRGLVERLLDPGPPFLQSGVFRM